MKPKEKKIIENIKQRIAYIKKYRIGGDYTNGFSGIESGPCCDKCRMDKKAVVKSGRAVALRLVVGCTNPFQVKASYNIKTGEYDGEPLCQCHIPYRKVATEAELNLLEDLLK